MKNSTNVQVSDTSTQSDAKLLIQTVENRRLDQEVENRQLDRMFALMTSVASAIVISYGLVNMGYGLLHSYWRWAC